MRANGIHHVGVEYSAVIFTERIKNSALKMAVATGRMPEVEFIWARQRAEGARMCFGQGRDCKESSCRWRSECVELEKYCDLPS